MFYVVYVVQVQHYDKDGQPYQVCLNHFSDWWTAFINKQSYQDFASYFHYRIMEIPPKTEKCPNCGNELKEVVLETTSTKVPIEGGRAWWLV